MSGAGDKLQPDRYLRVETTDQMRREINQSLRHGRAATQTGGVSSRHLTDMIQGHVKCEKYLSLERLAILRSSNI